MKWSTITKMCKSFKFVVVLKEVKPFQRLFLSARINDNIVQVDQTCRVVQFSQTVGHQSLESCWCIAEPKGHAFTLKESHHPYCRGSILFQGLLHRGLPETQKEIHSGVIFTPTESIDCIMDSRQ